MNTAPKGKEKQALLVEELSRARRRVEELQSRLGISGFVEPNAEQIEQRVWEVFSAMIVGVCLNEIVYDDSCQPVDYRILRCNSAYTSLIGLSDKQVIGRRASELYGSNGAPYLTTYAEVVASGIPVNFETHFEPMDKHFHVSVLSREPKRFITVFTDITESKRAEKKLRESEERFRSLLETSSDWIWETDQNGIYTYASPTCKKLVGYTPDEIVGISAFDLMPPEERQRVGDIFRTFVRDRKPISTLENVVIHKDGHRLILETSGEPIFNSDGDLIGYRGIDRDITYRKRVEEEHQRLALAVQYSGELVNMATLDGMMIFINDAGAKMLGIDQGEVGEIHIMQVIPDHLRDLVTNELLPVLMRGDIWQGELQYKNLKTGRITDVQAMTYTVPDPATGKPFYLANVSMDITARKQAERERRALEDQVQHMQKLESLGVLAGGIAHDFNNLLVGILGNADLALNRLPDGSPIRDNLKGIETSAVRAADLCQQMLAYSGKGKLVVDVVDLREVVKEMTQMLDVSVSKKAICAYHFEDNVPFVEADATQMRQIVLNLITNASEALGDKRGIISVSVYSEECDREHLSGSFTDDELPPGLYVCLEVTDNGQGMDEQTMERIFDPFFTTKFTGRGLGLSAVLGIIRGHKGSIKVQSEAGKGTRFQVFLPAAAKKRPEESVQEPAPKSWQGCGTILLVDDDERIRAIMPEMLADLGFEILTATNGREAVDVYKSHKDEILLVILDHTMPEMDGEETFYELQRIDSAVRVLLCSGYREQEITQKFVGTGPAGFIQKPFRIDDLISKLEYVLDK